MFQTSKSNGAQALTANGWRVSLNAVSGSRRETRRVARIGILAFGSLIDDPREQIEAVEVKAERKRGVSTPFKVEFARSSATREGAPTLVPFETGAVVAAEIIVVETSEQHAKDILWRRETGNETGHYRPRANPSINTLIIDTYALAGMPVVLAARFQPNIQNPTGALLARLAIASAKKLRDGKDGISYLMDAKRNGIVTPLSSGYEAEILRLTGADSLEAAHALLSPR